MSSDPKDHFAELMSSEHKNSGALDGGACIQGDCKGQYTPDHSCSYRWQVVTACRHGQYAGLGRQQHYVTPPGRQQAIPTMRFQTKDSKAAGMTPEFNPTDYPAMLPAPSAENGDWDIDGPKTPVTVKHNNVTYFTTEKGKNFETLIRPWWNNAHHMIPKATLRGRVENVPNPGGWAGPSTLAEVIKHFLLKAEYNVNHYRNMIILPMDAEVGKLIGLPRHLVLEDAAAKTLSGDKKTKMDHEAYGRLVNMELNPIIKSFIKAGKKARSNQCVTEEMKASKEALEELSDRCYRGITTGVAKGDPISVLKALPPLQDTGAA